MARAAQAATESQIVGRTSYDLLSESRLAGSLARLLRESDPVEVLGTLTYVLFGILGKKDAPTMQLWVFLGALAAYHALVRPLNSLLCSLMRR
jgi:hypothetical protein